MRSFCVWPRFGDTDLLWPLTGFCLLCRALEDLLPGPPRDRTDEDVLDAVMAFLFFAREEPVGCYSLLTG